jgi:hypothetical protein
MPDVKKFNKRVKNIFLVLRILTEIEQNGENIGKIAINLKRTKQSLNYHFKKLLSANFIKKEQSYPFAIYRLTPLGQRVKIILGQPEGVSNLWRCHDLIIGFNIESYGSFSFENRKIKPMKNWYYTIETIKDSIGEWGIHVQSTNLLKIYVPEKYHESPDFAFGNMERIATNLAQRFAETYSMKLGLMRIVREGHKELANSEMLAKLFGRTRIGNVWVDKSTGSSWMEETQSENKIEKLLETPERIDKLENHLTKQTEIMDQFSLQMKLHLEVLTEMKDTLKAIKESFQK